jgi:hypothetical protein
MAFESPDATHGSPFPDYTDTANEVVQAGYDAYPTTEIIQTDETEYTDSMSERANYYDIATPFVQMHLLGGQIITGEHPDERVNEALARVRAKKEAKIAKEITFLAGMSPLHFIDEHSSLYDDVKEQLVRDFNPEIAALPIVELSCEGSEYYNRVIMKTNDSYSGFYRYGHMILFNYAKRANFNPATQTTIKTVVALHEGAHASAQDSAFILTSRPLTEADSDSRDISDHERAIGYRVDAIYVGGFGEYIPDIRTDKATNRFWEEAFAESYSIRRKGSLDVPINHSTPSRINRLFPRQAYGMKFTDDPAQTFYDKDNKTLCLPWKYSKAIEASRKPGNPRYSFLSPDAYGAYALDILGSKLPGLFDAMVQSRQDFAAKQLVKDQINSISPGLYEDIGMLSENASGYELGLVKVIRALNLGNKRIGDIL